MDELEVNIFDGEVALEMRRCALVRLPDGGAAAVWRGLAFPILPGDRIDATGSAYAIAETLPLAENTKAFAVIDGQSEAYVLVAGGFVEAETVAGKLRQARIEVLRTGRYFGEPVAELEADWFVRIVRPVGADDLAIALEPILGSQAARPPAVAVADPRARLLTAELFAARAREAKLLGDIARLRASIAETAPETERQAAEFRDALEAERRLRQAAEQAEKVVEGRSRPPQSGRIATEVQDVLAGLLPHLRMLRDSIDVVAAEFASRQGVWRALGELTAAGGVPRDWKRIRGADGWWERHLINGRDNTGRIYVRKSAGPTWDVLMSHKSEQQRDIAWLARQ
jgi:hypothetical protein